MQSAGRGTSIAPGRLPLDSQLEKTLGGLSVLGSLGKLVEKASAWRNWRIGPPAEWKLFGHP